MKAEPIRPFVGSLQNFATGPQRVMVCDYPDGRLAIKHKGRELPYRVFDKHQRVNQAAIVENKRLGPVLAGPVANFWRSRLVRHTG